jgi:acyl-[acyl-carrier-protein]-phospholipid O-acyltransferase/long-chain-fatty-acid--[acyl-carrier-protein] ligase
MKGFWGIVIAQFTGAFNDNAFRWFLIGLATKDVSDENVKARIIALSASLFLIPYLLVSMHAGSLADRFSKRKVLMVSKAAEAAIMALIAFAFLGTEGGEVTEVSRFAYLFVLLFLLGIQAAYYSPAKFGALPEILPEKRLSWGNGVLELTGFIAIISGTACGPALLPLHHFVAPLVFSTVALIGLAATWFVPRVPPASPDRKVRINPLHDLLEHGGRLLANRLLFLTLLGVVYIWSLGLLFQLNVAVYAEKNLGLVPEQLGYPMATVALGVGVGCMLAGYLSGRTIEIGLVPLGAAGTALCSVALYLTSGSWWPSFAVFLFLGLFAGFFIVPTHAFLQEESADEDKGGIWAATNFLQTLGMLCAAGVFYILQAVLRLGPDTVFLIAGIFTLGTAGLIAWVLPETIGRLAVWLRAWRRRPLLAGQDNLPPHGPILLVASGEPRPEGFLILSGTRRLVRFVIPPEVLVSKPIRAAARWLRAILISGTTPEDALSAAMEAARKRLAEGEAVCMFARPPTALNGAGGIYRIALVKLMETMVLPVVPVRIAVDGEGSGAGGRPSIVFERPWDRTVPADRVLAAMEDGTP